MYTVFLSGGIASGKSTVSRLLSGLGAYVIDLDQVSRDVTADGSPACVALAREFGADVLDSSGSLRRDVLAARAFATAQATAALERIEHPFIRERLIALLEDHRDDEVVVVEIPLLDRVEDLLPLANEVLCVVCPLKMRRARAIGRGMDEKDFDRRVRQQASDVYLVAHATTVINNDKDERELERAVRAWWHDRSDQGWKGICAV